MSNNARLGGFAFIAAMAPAAYLWAAPADIVTQHNNQSRTGANLAETQLIPSAIGESGFGRLNTIPYNARSYAQVLYRANVPSAKLGTRNYVHIATMANQVYAFDADLDSSEPVWQTALGTPVPLPCVRSGQTNGIPSKAWLNIGPTGSSVGQALHCEQRPTPFPGEAGRAGQPPCRLLRQAGSGICLQCIKTARHRPAIGDDPGRGIPGAIAAICRSRVQPGVIRSAAARVPSIP
jgi:hypothetical protein